MVELSSTTSASGLLRSIEETRSRPMSRKQIFCLIIMAYGNFCIAASCSLQAPFFPGECDIKGVSSLIYGLIFGVFELVIILTCPIFSKMFTYITLYFFLKFGLFLTGITVVLLGVLDKVTKSFAELAFCLRIGEAVGAAAFIVSSYNLIASNRSCNSIDSDTVLNIASSLGALLGPPIGGMLFMSGGYAMPFVVYGSLLLFGSLVSTVILPKSEDYTLNNGAVSFHYYSDRLVEILITAGHIALTGFNEVTLAHHLSQFDLSPIVIGSIFIVDKLGYWSFRVVWCGLARSEFDTLWIAILGTVFNIIGLLLIGPASFLPMEPKIWLIILSLIIIGIGLAAKQIGSFVSTNYDYLNMNLTRDDFQMISNLVTIAAFVGPVTGGYLIGSIGL